MKKILIFMFAASMACASCGKDDADGNEQIVLPNQSEQTQQAFADDDTTGGFTFTAKSSWTATVTEDGATRAGSVSWLRLLYEGEEKYSGEAGTFTLVIEIDENYSGQTRTATITVTSGADKITVTVTQDGKTEDGVVPEEPRMVVNITESAQFNSDYYSGENFNGTYEPHYYEFKYDDRDRLKEYYIRHVNGGSDYEKYTFDYGVQGELRISNGEFTDIAILNAQGYVSKYTIDDWDDPAENPYYTYTYDAEGYVKEIADYEYDGATPEHSRYLWTNGNRASIEAQVEGEWEIFAYTYSPDLNNSRVNLDLNGFVEGIFDYMDPDPMDDPLFIFAMADRFGKRSKNYLIGMTDERELDDPLNEVRIYTESNLPPVGYVLSTGYDRNYYGAGTWSLDSEGCPVSYTHKIEVVKTERVYNGQKTIITPDEYEVQEWLDRYGPGPYYTITLAPRNTTLYDTYTWQITYKE